MTKGVDEPVEFLENGPFSKTAYCSERCERIFDLQKKKVTVILGFDGTQIHKHAQTKDKIFDAIHWNCPHDGSNFKDQTLPPMIKDFFASASQVQNSGGKIYMTLAQPPRKEKFYQGYIYNIRDAASSSGYKLYAKRPFGKERYSEYEHEMTYQSSPAKGADRLREFVFVKSSFKWPETRERSHFNKEPFYGEQREFYVRDTDEESTDYSEDEGDDTQIEVAAS